MLLSSPHCVPHSPPISSAIIGPVHKDSSFCYMRISCPTLRIRVMQKPLDTRGNTCTEEYQVTSSPCIVFEIEECFEQWCRGKWIACFMHSKFFCRCLKFRNNAIEVIPLLCYISREQLDCF